MSDSNADNPRVSVRRPGVPDPDGRCVLYWMQRAQRGRDNLALEHAIELGNHLKLPVLALFGLTTEYPGAQRRHYRFLVDGLPEIRDQLSARGVEFVVRIGSPDDVALEVANEEGAAIVVGDENPLRIGKSWRERVKDGLRVPFETVDADVVVPSRLFPKEEWAARTLRIKMHKVWNDHLKPHRNAHARISWPDDARIAGESIDSRNDQYDSLNGCPNWALATLAKHASDPRPYLYSASQLEAGDTHDHLQNAAQMEMVLTGRMHNYLRMYWAKKILEWTPDAVTAFDIALDLNDRYEMDGHDPNGYEGVAWAIGGKHDRPWPERPILGTVRFMSFNSTHKKFDSKAYIARVQAIEGGKRL